MNLLLQNTRTKDYVTDADGWTPRHDQARVFATGMEAMFFCLSHNMAHMQILGEFADWRMNFAVPVTDERAELPAS
jgi:hypothetical protein